MLPSVKQQEENKMVYKQGSHYGGGHSAKGPNSKCLSTSHMPKTQGKLSSTPVLTKQKGKHYSLNNASGSVGSNTRTFHNTLTNTPGKK